MLKKIKEVGGEAGNDSTNEAKAGEGFQRSSTDCLEGSWQRQEGIKNNLTASPTALPKFCGESSGISIATNYQGKKGC